MYHPFNNDFQYSFLNGSSMFKCRKTGDYLRICVSIILFAVIAACAFQQEDVSKVTIYRDDWGVPHLYAKNEEAAFFGLGYAQAQDQLQMTLVMAMWAQGRRAEIQGKKYLAGDIEMRRWRHMEEAEAGFARLTPQLRKNYYYYVAGFKKFMSENPDSVPDWAPELTPALFVAISRAAIWSGYHMIEGPKECRTSPDKKRELAEIQQFDTKRASNGWVVMPARTANGALILGADPHVTLQNPTYYEYRMDAGNLKSSGYAMGPMLWQAHNRHVVWAMTTGNPDMWDCYQVNVDPDDKDRFLYDDQWQKMETRHEVFHVLGGDDVKHVFEYTRHNGVLSPVVSRKGNTAFVVSSSQMHDAGLMDEEIYKMNFATSVTEIKAAMSGLGMLPQNVIVGDDKGNALYIRAGKTPRRPKGFDWQSPLPGNSSKTAWSGYHALEDMVQIENPEQGYLQNNNVSPDRMFAEGNLKAEDYPDYLFNDTPGRITTRGIRTIDVLSKAKNFTLEDAFALSFDEKWVTADAWLRALRYSATQYSDLIEKLSPNTKKFIENLMTFDGFAHAESVAALNFYFWRQEMGDVLSRPEFAELRKFPWSENQFTRNFAIALVEKAEKAAEKMRHDFGSIDRPLGAVFRMGRGEKTWPVGGETIIAKAAKGCVAEVNPLCDRTMRAFASIPIGDGAQRKVYRGSQSMRIVVMSNPIQSFSLHSYGQSDVETSSYWDNQSRLVSEHKFKPTYFYRQDLDGHITSKLELTVPAKNFIGVNNE